MARKMGLAVLAAKDLVGVKVDVVGEAHEGLLVQQAIRYEGRIIWWMCGVFTVPRIVVLGDPNASGGARGIWQSVSLRLWMAPTGRASRR